MRPNANFHGGLRTGVSLQRFGGVLLRCTRSWLYAHPCLAEDKSDKGTLRPAKSMDSLSAVAGVSDGEYRCALVYLVGGGGVRVGMASDSISREGRVFLNMCWWGDLHSAGCEGLAAGAKGSWAWCLPSYRENRGHSPEPF